MADKNNSKFPYIILPNLSGDNITTPLAAEGRQGSGSVSKNVKLPRIPAPTPNSTTKVEHLSTVKTASTSTSSSVKQSKGMSRHIALSKQYAATASPTSTPQQSASQPTRQLSKELLAIRAEVMNAHFDKRSSPQSFYPSSLDDEQPDARKLDLEAISQLFPPRKQVKSSKTTTPSAAAAAKSFLDKVKRSNSSELVLQDSNATLDQLKSRIEGLTVHVKTRDAEVAKLKECLTQIQCMMLKERQESSGTNELMERLSANMEILSDKLERLEHKLIHQETNILNKLLLIDEMSNSDEDDSDYGKIECKPSNWMTTATATSSTSSSSSSTINPEAKPVDKSPVPVRKGHNNHQYSSGINSLKECVNWVPIAPDFDKLLNVIALLNFRMDRNQSMQLSRNGNEVTFKHADTIPLVLYKNGLTLANTGFRSYATLSVIKLINEMFGGYFPSELHSQYPDGIVFVVSDKRSIAHELCPGFNGPGVKLQNDPKSAPVLLPGAERLSLRKSDLSKNDLLKSKSDLSIASSCASDVSISRRSCCILPDLNKLCKHHGGGHKMISLKLKNIENGRLYQLRLSTSSTIDAVLEHLEKHLRPSSDSSSDSNLGSGDCNLSNQKEITSGKFDIVLPLPYGILTSGNSTLKEYGLVTNTLLYIQPVPSISTELEVSTEDFPEEAPSPSAP